MSSHNATRLKAGLEEDNESPLGEATRCESFEAALGQDPMWAVLWLIPGSMAFKEAERKAKPVLLEPVMAVEVTVPEEYMGAIIGDLNSRRGRIEGLEMVGGVQAIKATVPLSNMFGYATAMRDSTRPSPAPKPPPSCRSSTRSWASPLG